MKSGNWSHKETQWDGMDPVARLGNLLNWVICSGCGKSLSSPITVSTLLNHCRVREHVVICSLYMYCSCLMWYQGLIVTQCYYWWSFSRPQILSCIITSDSWILLECWSFMHLWLAFSCPGWAYMNIRSRVLKNDSCSSLNLSLMDNVTWIW